MLKSLIVLVVVGVLGQHAHAQGAWTPPAQTLSVDASYQLGHGTRSENVEAPVTHHYVIPEIEYGILDALAVSISLPIVAIKTEPGTRAHGSWDDGNYHATPTDVRATLRYMVPLGFLAITPQLGGSVPTRDYETRGFAGAGRHLKTAYVGVNVGADLDAVVPRTFLHLSYELGLAERYVAAGPEGEQFSQHFSTLGFLAAHSVGSFTLAGGLDYVHYHDGIRYDDFGTITDNQRMHHDALLIERILLVGGGVGYSINDSVEVYANARFFAWGENTHNSSLFSVGATWSYGL